jgi:hypothetical protein
MFKITGTFGGSLSPGPGCLINNSQEPNLLRVTSEAGTWFAGSPRPPAARGRLLRVEFETDWPFLTYGTQTE